MDSELSYNGVQRRWTRKEAARFLNCSERTIDRRIRDGVIRASHLGRQVLVDPASIVEKLTTVK